MSAARTRAVPTPLIENDNRNSLRSVVGFRSGSRRHHGIRAAKRPTTCRCWSGAHSQSAASGEKCLRHPTSPGAAPTGRASERGLPASPM
jgi:hypothetical protein